MTVDLSRKKWFYSFFEYQSSPITDFGFNTIRYKNTKDTFCLVCYHFFQYFIPDSCSKTNFGNFVRNLKIMVDFIEVITKFCSGKKREKI